MDYSNAYLNSQLTEEAVYMRKVTGYVDPSRQNYVCRLKKAVYGLPQSAACWNSTMTASLTKKDFRQSMIDKCLFYEPISKSYIGGYVGDLVLMPPDDLVMSAMKRAIGEDFPFKPKGDEPWAI